MRRTRQGSHGFAWRSALGFGAGAFLLALVADNGAASGVRELSAPAAAAVVLAIIAIGVLFDAIGVAVLSAAEAPFHAMAAHRAPGAAQAVWLVRNASRVASFANDLVGDVAGIVSGSGAAYLGLRWAAARPALPAWLVGALVTAVVAALSIGGRAWAKGSAIAHAHQVTLAIGRSWYTVATLWRRLPGVRRSAGLRRW